MTNSPPTKSPAGNTSPSGLACDNHMYPQLVLGATNTTRMHTYHTASPVLGVILCFTTFSYDIILTRWQDSAKGTETNNTPPVLKFDIAGLCFYMCLYRRFWSEVMVIRPQKCIEIRQCWFVHMTCNFVAFTRGSGRRSRRLYILSFYSHAFVWQCYVQIHISDLQTANLNGKLQNKLAIVSVLLHQ